jgi:hypothetical protein
MGGCLTVSAASTAACRMQMNIAPLLKTTGPKGACVLSQCTEQPLLEHSWVCVVWGSKAVIGCQGEGQVRAVGQSDANEVEGQWGGRVAGVICRF